MACLQSSHAKLSHLKARCTRVIRTSGGDHIPSPAAETKQVPMLQPSRSA